MFELDKLTQLADFIQPYVPSKELFHLFVVTSFFLLLLFAIVELVFHENMTEKFRTVFFSEQDTFQYFLSTSMGRTIQAHLTYLFFSTQVAYLLPLSFVESVEINFLIKVVLFYGVFLCKNFIYSSLHILLGKRININYFLFNYESALFFVAVPLFVFILAQEHFQWLNEKVILLIICLVLFYVWLLVRLFFIGTRYQRVRSLYFFLYLCALEFAPIIIGMKIVRLI